MQPDRDIRLTAGARRTAHLLFASMSLAFVVSAAAAIAAPTTTPLSPTGPTPKAFALLPEVDLMEANFREGNALYESGDYRAAIRAWQGPAERGHAGAQFSIGVAYATGNGVPQDLGLAVSWWQLAANAGHVTAQLNLGLLYWRGEGVEKDLIKAQQWWRRAADGGDAVAQFHLGAMAAIGEGGPLDYDEALRWWRLSAAQGYQQAIKGLEILKSHGFSAEKTAH